MIVSKQVAKIAFMPDHLVVPGVIVFVLKGAWLVACAGEGLAEPQKLSIEELEYAEIF